MMLNKLNPFAQSRYYWVVRMALPGNMINEADDKFSDIALAVSSFEVDEKLNKWNMELLFDHAPDMAEVKRRLIILCSLYNITQPEMHTEKLAQQDWLANVARDFPPIRLNRLYVHGAHCRQDIPTGVIPVQVDAGAAFGSGEHGTTKCCLMALEYLAKQRHCANVLDMGCGSGILAIAAAKLWRSHVVASDIDPIAVRVTQENARINRVTQHMTMLVSNGYAHPAIRRAAPYELIISNILAKPLVYLAKQVPQHLAPGGQVVLSGLLATQERYVAEAYAQHHLFVKKRFIDAGWCTLVCSKG
ncbi:MAG: 50S ribosomal protein L11 methyltransferase [Alphaproteobacteria bacterium]